MTTEPISTYLWPGETNFGYGAAQLAGEKARARGGQVVFLLADPGVIQAGLVAPVAESLKAAGCHVVLYDQVEANPSYTSVNEAARAFREAGAEVIVGVGGGSGLDTAKAVKLLAGGPPGASIWEYATMLGDQKRPYPRPGQMPPYIAIPTTAGTGAEVTPWAVLTHTEKEIKFGVGDGTTVPDVALVDPALTLSLPAFLTAATGMDALSHLIEAYVSTNHNPVLDPMILTGIQMVGQSLRPAVAHGDNRQARSEMLHASMIGGIAISSKWLGACHSLAHPLSSLAGVHHGLACAIMLPHQISYSLIGAVERYADVYAALTGDDEGGPARDLAGMAPAAVYELMVDIGLPTSLSEVGVTEAHLAPLAQAAITDLNWWTNPRQVSESVMHALYMEAF